MDRSQDPRRDSEPGDCQCLSMPATRSRRMLRRTASDGTRCAKSLAQSSEAQGPTATALSPEETREFLPSEPRPPQDTKKDKAQWRTQQGWLRTMMNFFFGTGHEESKEKASKRAKGKEGPPEPAETPETLGEPAPRKKAHHKKASRKKHSHKKHSAEEVKGAEGQEAKAAAASCCGEADLGPGAGEGDISDLHCFLLFEGRSAGVQGISSQATGHQREEELRKPDSESESALGPLLGQPIADRMDCSGDCSDLGWWLLKNMCLSCPFWCFWSYLLMLEPHGRDSQELGDKSSCFMCS